jgi:hypothetical protein
MKLTSHFHLVPRLRSEAITPIPLIPLWCVKESIYFTLVQNLSTDQTTNIENKKRNIFTRRKKQQQERTKKYGEAYPPRSESLGEW